MNRTVLVALVFVLAACAGTPFKWEDADKVQNGMTEAEVISILGKPRARSQSGNITILRWTYATNFGGRSVSYRLVDGRVTGVTSVGR